MKYFSEYYFSAEDQHHARHTSPSATTTREAVSLIEASFQRSLAAALQGTTSNKIGVLLSGGVDSSLLAAMLRRLTDKEIVCFTAMTETTDPDVLPSKELSQALGVKWVKCRLTKKALDVRLKQLLPITKGGLYGTAYGLAMEICMDSCAQEGIDNLWTGNGLDMCFGGGLDPSIFKATAADEFHQLFWKYSFNLLKEFFYNHDYNEVERMAADYKVKVVMPFDNLDTIVCARSIPAELFFRYHQDKYPVRLLAHRYGVPLHLARRPKDPLQHSSGVFELLREYMYEMLPDITYDAVNFKLNQRYFRENPNTDIQIFLTLLAARQGLSFDKPGRTGTSQQT